MHTRIKTIGRWLLGLAVPVILGIVVPRYLWFARGRLPRDARHLCITMADGTQLAAVHLSQNRNHLIVIAHGFLKRMDNVKVLWLARQAYKQADVLLYDQMGHGQSDGLADLDMARAGANLAQVVSDAHNLGYARVSVVGLSLGAGAAIYAAAQGCPVDAVVSISSPTGIEKKFEGAWEPGVAQHWFEVMGTRVAESLSLDGSPLAVVGRMAPCPLLVVHCGLDVLIPRAASEALYEAAREPKAWLLDATALHAAPRRSVPEILSWLDYWHHQARMTEGSDAC